MIFLPEAENRTIVSSFIWTKHRNVTDGRTVRQTERQNRSGYYSGLHCEQCGRAVTMHQIARSSHMLSVLFFSNDIRV